MTNMNRNPLDVRKTSIYISNKSNSGNITHERCLGTVLDAQSLPNILVGQILQPRGPVHVLSDMQPCWTEVEFKLKRLYHYQILEI